ncbi:TonB family protein (plasmid) [Falsihalocynthiibacter sp. SS001]|uniref:energy transducer TonB family protein n=1 Tax=Falsihalocynthiibacter sp. SS001 TaxID=3349698 RepID=UPI0036D33600
MNKLLFPCAILLSGAVHIALVGIGPTAPEPVLEGGDVAGEVALGLGFADLVAGNAGAAPTSTTPRVEPAATAQSVTPPSKLSPVEPAKSPAPKSVQSATAPAKSITAKTPPKAEKTAATAPSKQGNAAVNNTKGQATGAKSATAAEANKAPKSTAKQVGNGAMKSYQSDVLRQIARVPKRRAGARGDALVGISITPNGAISAALIVQSSGHAAIDKLAVAQIKRAAPFKPTPTGATIKVVVRFQSKG